ncbi:MAG: hypothetical protein P4L79_15035 [Legionella sp.]|uniref:hypothetical protein n=1 Tax=Legionella sp. TaxID=459 RepID=UPI00283B0F8C|nr:hypothetical protein [Legionella sp.]
MQNYDEPISAQSRIEEIYKRLNEELELTPEPKDFEEMIRPWECYVKGYKLACHPQFDVEKERDKLDTFVKKLEGMIKVHENLKTFNNKIQKYLKNFHLDEMYLGLEYPEDDEKVRERKIKNKKHKEDRLFAQSIQKKITGLNKLRPFLLKPKSAAVNPKTLEEAAIQSLFVLGEKKFGLTSGGKGRGNKNQLVEFAMIVSGFYSRDTIDNYHEKYKKIRDLA